MEAQMYWPKSALALLAHYTDSHLAYLSQCCRCFAICGSKITSTGEECLSLCFNFNMSHCFTSLPQRSETKTAH